MPTAVPSPATPEPELTIPIDVVSYVATMAKEFDAKEGDSDPDSGSNATDDGDADVLEDKPGDTVQQELLEYINGLNEDYQIELVALAWLGRGTFDIGEWSEALETARQEHNKRTGQYLLGLPLLGDYLEEGLDAFGESIVDMDDTRDTAPDTDKA
ncbi:MAG: DUF3775 domain-containing protein [Rhizomicrobium sp.]